METGTNQQNIENPLLLLPLFGKEIFILKSDIQSLSEGESQIGSLKDIVKNDSLDVTANPNGYAGEVSTQNAVEQLGQIQQNQQTTQTKQSENSQTTQPIQNPKQKVKILNLFVDSSDGVFSDSTREAYEKLMTNLKVEGLPIQFMDVAMINTQNSLKIKSMSNSKGMTLSPDLWNEFDAEYCVLWSDSPLVNPAMKHYSMSNFNNSKLIFLPGFNSMLLSTELKKNVWIAFKQLVGFV